MRGCPEDDIGPIEDVQLSQLVPSTTLLVKTINSLYRVVIVEATEVSVQGGAFFRDPEPASLDGYSTDQPSLKVGWIAVGRMMEFRSRGRRIVTSPVQGIVIEPPSCSSVH
jgi:hypothetical protein